jgi:ubiquitin-activating enzyme E1 C
LYNIASARAKEFKIEGVTWSLTQGVVKNIIPAIASTNAIIAGMSAENIIDNRANVAFIASCCNEAFKLATSSAAPLDNYFMLMGTDSVYSYTFKYEKRDACPVCGNEPQNFEIASDATLENLIEQLVDKPGVFVHILSRMHP